MSDSDFITLVRDMRLWQRTYFSNTRDYSALRTCRDFEKRVDAELRRREEGKPAQGKLI